jgi:CRP-like cAMP-binding protein
VGVLIGEAELGREHADDGVGGAVQVERFADDVGIARELILPKAVADDGDGRAAGAVLLGEEVAAEVRLDWPYTQSYLASMIGGTRQSVNKLLSGLVDDRLVVIERDTLIVTDVDALGRMAER